MSLNNRENLRQTGIASAVVLAAVGGALIMNPILAPESDSNQSNLLNIEPTAEIIVPLDANRSMEFGLGGAMLLRTVGIGKVSVKSSAEYTSEVPPFHWTQPVTNTDSFETYTASYTKTTLSDVECDAATKQLIADIHYKVDEATISDPLGHINEEDSSELALVLGPDRYSEVQTIENVPLGYCPSEESFAIHSGRISLMNYSYRVIS